MSIPALFAKPHLQEVYACLTKELDSLGAYEVQEKKTSVHVTAGKAAFLGVHPRKDGLRLNVVLARPLQGERVAKVEQVSRSRYHNELDIKSASEFDPELRGWLQEARSLQE